MSPNKGIVLIMTPEEHARLADELAIMQREVLQGGPWQFAVNILHSVVHNSVDTDYSADENPSADMIGIHN